MKSINYKIYLFALFISLFSFNSSADNYPNTSIAIVDLNLILSESKAAKNATEQFEKIQKTLKMRL